MAEIFAPEDFKYVEGFPATFALSDLETPLTRHFCANCGTGGGRLSPARPNLIIVMVGTFDDQSFFKP